jgi:hypothetical protein
MKKKQKIIVSLTAAALLTAPIIITSINQAHAAQTTDQTQNKITADGTLTLNHNTRIYNKKGQKLYSYQRSNGLLKKGATVSYVNKPQTIADPDTVRYSFHDDDWNWFYLPYKTIKGQEYYSIGHGGYVKAANVKKIDEKYLYTNKASLKIDKSYSNGVQVMDSNGKSKNKKLSPGQKVTFDRSASTIDFYGNNIDGDDDSEYYRIAGSDEFVRMDTDVLRQQLLPYSNYMDVLLINDGYVYTKQGNKLIRESSPNEVVLPNQKDNKKSSTVKINKGHIEAVSSAVNLWVPEEEKTELFYRLQNKNLFSEVTTELYIKASDVKYVYGKQLK